MYGHNSMLALRSANGFLCYQWFSAPYTGIILFVEAKTAKEWLKEVNKIAAKDKSRSHWALTATPHVIHEHPPELKPLINPPTDLSDLGRIMSRAAWQSW